MYKNNMKILRENKGISLSDLSKQSGISVGYLCHLERGTRKNPSISVMDKISSALNKSVSEIFFSENK